MAGNALKHFHSRCDHYAVFRSKRELESSAPPLLPPIVPPLPRPTGVDGPCLLELTQADIKPSGAARATPNPPPPWYSPFHLTVWMRGQNID